MTIDYGSIRFDCTLEEVPVPRRLVRKQWSYKIPTPATILNATARHSASFPNAKPEGIKAKVNREILASFSNKVISQLRFNVQCHVCMCTEHRLAKGGPNTTNLHPVSSYLQRRLQNLRHWTLFKAQCILRLSQVDMDEIMEKWLELEVDTLKELEGDWCPGLKGRLEEARWDEDYVKKYGGSAG